jgi:hypothetical protein
MNWMKGEDKGDDVGLSETFCDDKLKDVDKLMFEEEKIEKRSALFHTMYRSELDQPSREPKQKKQSKKKKEGRKKKKGQREI